MTAQHTGVPTQEHETVHKLLPWYAESGLSPAERALAERHLENCPACRAELDRYRWLGTAFEARGETDAWQPSEAHFERLLTIIDAAGRQATEPVKPPKPRRSWLGALRVRLGDTPLALRWALGVETLALAALALALVIPRPPGGVRDEAAFETLTSAAESVGEARGPRVRVVFAGDATEAEIRGLLRAIRGQLVAGPSSIGVYTVELSAAGAADEALGQAVKTLRADPKVRLAEPVPGGTAP